MADDLDLDCDDRLRWRTRDPWATEREGWAFLGRLKSLMWPYGKDTQCIDLSDPENVQKIFLLCVRHGAVTLDQREIFFAEAAHDNRTAVRKRGGILKERVWANQRTANRIDLFQGRQMIQDLDSGETARRKLELKRRDEWNKCQNASYELHILRTDDPWTHPAPRKAIVAKDLPISERFWLKPTEKQALIRQEEESRKAAEAAAENSRLETLHGPTIDNATEEDLIELLGDNTLLIRFLHTNGRDGAMKTLRPTLLRALDRVHDIAELPY